MDGKLSDVKRDLARYLISGIFCCINSHTACLNISFACFTAPVEDMFLRNHPMYKNMRRFFIFHLIFFWVTASPAQVSDSKISQYARWISQRNARLIGCDSIAPYLEPIYAKLIKKWLLYRSSMHINGNQKKLIKDFRHAKKEIYKLFSRKKKKHMKHLVRLKGDLFLL